MKTRNKSNSLLGFAAWLFVSASTVCADEFDSGGVKIHYDVMGKGDPVILIHGLDSSAKINWELPGIAAELAKDHQVIAMDCRGHGQSGKPEAEGAYGVNMVEDVVRLMDRLHIQKAQVVGYSMGGMIAMKLLVTHPERVTSAVLGGMGWLKADAPLNKFWELAGDQGKLKAPAACIHGFAALAVTEQEIRAVKQPVVIIVGDRDPARRLYVEPLHAIRPEWPVHVIADAGHLNCIAKPDFKAQVKAAVDKPATR